MGYGSTSGEDLRARAAYRASTGTTFTHTSSMHSTAHHLRKVHESLDPKRVNSVGEKIRECLDSDEHPLTVPVFVGFDETGSMGSGPRIIQEKLGLLKGLTLRAGMPDVQLAFGAYGDAQNNEVAPCQVGQFESGIEMEEWLNNLYLEGNGGGNGGETAGLLLYFLANFSRLDSLNKRGKKGYIFLTGDEIALTVTRAEIKTYLDEDVEADISMEEVIRQVTESYDVYFFLVQNGAAKSQGSEAFWSNLLGTDHVIPVENLENISELIAGLLAVQEGVVTSADTLGDMLHSEGSDSTAVELVKNVVATRIGGSSTVVKTASAGKLSASAGSATAETI
jgi:hypothetical protein